MPPRRESAGRHGGLLAACVLLMSAASGGEVSNASVETAAGGRSSPVVGNADPLASEEPASWAIREDARPRTVPLALAAAAQSAEEEPSETDPPSYTLRYRLAFQPSEDTAKIRIAIDKGRLLRRMEFTNLASRYSEIEANGDLSVTPEKVIWKLPAEAAWLTMTVKVSHAKRPGVYDARMTNDWAIFRGDDIFPSAATDEVPGAYAVATLEVVLPEGWSSVETGWPRKSGNTFRIDNPDRLYDRPVGWMIAGDLGTRRSKIGKTRLTVSAPKGAPLRRMEVLTFLNFVWPEVRKAFGKVPRKLLIVGMGDPMWRGGLSASNSLFLHADRPLVSENGTSPLLHELTHMVTRIRGIKSERGSDDWIAEGWAEFYSFELLYRAGGMTKGRREAILAKLGAWGEQVKNLRAQESKGPVTARAVVWIDELDREIRRRSSNDASIDDVTRDLMKIGKVSLADLKASVEALIGEDVAALRSPLVQ